jgi:uncharacterized protein (DUF58 family)
MSIAPDSLALMALRSLELRAKVAVEGLWRGLHRSPYHGFSVEFTEYRSYVKGDDLRHIDWKVAARTDRLYIKKFEDETNLPCHIVLDQSRSMAYPTQGPYSKSAYAATMAATLAYFFMQQGDAVGLTTIGDRIHQHLPARNRPGHWRRLLVELDKSSQHRGTALQASLQHVAGLVRRRGLIVIISDFNAPLDHLERQLGWFTVQGQEVVIFHILDRTELTLDLKPGHLVDMETGAERFINTHVLRPSYQRAVQDHIQALKAAADKQGAKHYLIPTDTRLDSALLQWLSQR